MSSEKHPSVPQDTSRANSRILLRSFGTAVGLVFFGMAGGLHGEALTLEARAARIANETAEIVSQPEFPGQQGVALKPGVKSRVGQSKSAPDLVFHVRAPQAGRYVIRSLAAVDEPTAAVQRKAKNKFASIQLMLSVDGARPTHRVVFTPWSPPERSVQTLGKFPLSGEDQEIRVWLPEGVRLGQLEIVPFQPPRVPAAAAAYQPKILPPQSHPRLWVNADSLPQVRARLDKGENAPVWEAVKKLAETPFPLVLNPEEEISYNVELERAAAAKAFVHLMTGEAKPGLEAVDLIRRYLAAVEFGNLLDITRELGRALYTGALVYDWCYDLMTPEDREEILRNFLRLADDMEIGWPPFGQPVVNGHGNEAQVNRDLLSMAIAIYDENPTPYQYCSYRILEELVPMRAFEYQSPRHNQGVSYGPYRFRWDLHAAWLFLRMTGKPVFDPNIEDVYQFWLSMRLPNGQLLRDGDGFSDGKIANFDVLPLLASAYAKNPIIKGDFLRQGGAPKEPILFLLLNDPNLKAVSDLGSLPLTKDFGPVLGSLIARTGWHLGPNEADVVVEMKGGGYQMGNHQHADAGSFQIYYRGLQAVDLGQYLYYGTPFDRNFNKRSIAHNMLLAIDPAEDFGFEANDGGTRSVSSSPGSVRELTTDPLFANGRVVSASFGPSPTHPVFSYFSVDLTSAYSRKIVSFTRTFCFLNLKSEKTPAALVILDNMTTSKPEFKKYWQINTLQPPEPTGDGVILKNADLGRQGTVHVRMLLPTAEDRDMKILSGPALHDVFGKKYTPPFPDIPESHGHRILFSPKTSRAHDVFFTLLQMVDADTPAPPWVASETPVVFTLSLSNHFVALSKSGSLLDQAFEITIPGGPEQSVLLAGLAPGKWSIQGGEPNTLRETQIEPGRNAAFLSLPSGTYSVTPKGTPKNE